MNVACLNQKLWSQLCEAIGRPELADDERFATNADRVEHVDALEEELAGVFEQRTTDEWIELLAEEHGLPVGPVYEVDEALENEQTDARGAVGEMEPPAAGTIPVLAHPLKFDEAESGFDRPPQMLGEHTESVLREAGYSNEQIEALKESGAISKS